MGAKVGICNEAPKCLRVKFRNFARMISNTEVKNRLKALADSRLRDFTLRLTPDLCRPVLGVRMPLLRKLARELARQEGAEALLQTDLGGASHEEVMLRGLLVGELDADADTWFRRVAAFVPLIDNWAVCDCTCVSLTRIRQYADKGWTFLQPYLDSHRTYELRFGIVMLLDHYVNDAYIRPVLERLAVLQPQTYYARMALGWALAECFVKYPETTLPYLRRTDLQAESRRMALQKIVESRRLTAAWRPLILQLRRQRP